MRARMERSRRAVGRYPREGGSVEIWRETRAGENGGERRAFGRPAAREDARETASGDDARCERPAARRTEVFQQLAPEPARADDEDVHHVVEHGFDVLAGLEPRARDGPPAKEETVDVGPSPGKVAAVVHGVRHHRHPGGAARAKRGRVRARESTRGSKTVSGACGHRDDRTSTTTHQWRRTKEQLGPFLGLNDARVHTPRARRVAPAARSRCRPRSRTPRSAAHARASGSARGRARRGADARGRRNRRVRSRPRHAPRTSPRSRATLAGRRPRAPRPVADTTSATVPDPKPATGPRPPLDASELADGTARPRCRRVVLSTRPTTSRRRRPRRARPLDAQPPRRVPRLALDRIPGAHPGGARPAPTAAADSARRGVGADAGLTPPSAARVPARDDVTERDRTRATRLATRHPHRSASAAGPTERRSRAAPPFDLARTTRAWSRRETAPRAAAAAAAASAATEKPTRVSALAGASPPAASRAVASSPRAWGLRKASTPGPRPRMSTGSAALAAVGERLERTPGAIPGHPAGRRRSPSQGARGGDGGDGGDGRRRAPRVASVRGINDAVGSSPSSAGPRARRTRLGSEPSASSSSSDGRLVRGSGRTAASRARARPAVPPRGVIPVRDRNVPETPDARRLPLKRPPTPPPPTTTC